MCENDLRTVRFTPLSSVDRLFPIFMVLSATAAAVTVALVFVNSLSAMGGFTNYIWLGSLRRRCSRYRSLHHAGGSLWCAARGRRGFVDLCRAVVGLRCAGSPRRSTHCRHPSAIFCAISGASAAQRVANHRQFSVPAMAARRLPRKLHRAEGTSSAPSIDQPAHIPNRLRLCFAAENRWPLLYVRAGVLPAL